MIDKYHVLIKYEIGSFTSVNAPYTVTDIYDRNTGPSQVKKARS